MRNFVEDIIPPDRKSIRQISRTTEGKNSNPTGEDRHTPVQEISRQSIGAIPRDHPKRTKFWLGVLAVAILTLLAMQIFFSGASVSVVPQRAIVGISTTFSAALDGSENSAESDITYRTMTLEDVHSERIAATGEEEVEEKASGEIIIFNNFSTADQRLIKNTRFATPDGLEYRIPQSVIVPGINEKDGVDVPGSIEVTVFADQFGDNYNIGLTDFTIPGFEEAYPERYSSIYARSKTPMVGGFVGTRKTVSVSDRATALEESHARLETELRRSANSEVPEDYLLLDYSAPISFESLPSEESGETVTLNEKAMLSAIIVERGDLSGLIARETIASFEKNQRVMIENFDELEINLVAPDESLEIFDNQIFFSVKGEASIVWQIDAESLKAGLSGKSRNDIPAIILDHPEIDEIKASFWPFWKSSFPEDVGKISVEQKLD